VLETSILVTLFLTSTLFHLCQVGAFCLDLQANDWQRADHFVVYLALIWFAMYFVGIAEKTRVAVVFFLLPVLLLLVSKHLNEMLVTIIVVAVVAALVILGIEFALFRNGVWDVQWGALFTTGIYLTAGVVLHLVGGDYVDGKGIYPLYHSLWHVLAMVALFFILSSRDEVRVPAKPRKEKKRKKGERKKRRKKRSDRTVSLV
jgi:hypothetical protein